MSPIENVWAILKDAVFKKGTPATVRIAKGRVNKFFGGVDEELCEKLVKSFQKRLLELEKNGFQVVGH